MSPRAACRLESLGFDDVHDYVAGKSDWLARGLPTAGGQSRTQRAHEVARADVVVVGLAEPAGAVAERVRNSPYPFALVASERGVVLGRLPLSALADSDREVAAERMTPGPSTVRADADAAELRDRLRAKDLQFAVVTTPDGVLIGVVRASDP